MFERVEINQKITENMKDDEEFEMLLGEIPYETSLNLHHPQNSGQHVNGGHGHGSFMNQTMNGMIYGKYDDDPSFFYRCASPASGLSLKSDDSSSSLLSIGHSFSDYGSPTPPPLEELKSQMPCAGPHHPNGLLMDFKAPDSRIGKMCNEHFFIDELNLSRNIGGMRINDEQDNPLVDHNGVGLLGNSICTTNRIYLEKYGAFDNYRRGFSDCGGPRSSIPKGSMFFDGEMSSGLRCEYNLDNLMELHCPRGRADGWSSQTNCYNSSSSSPCNRMKEWGLPTSNLASHITESSVANALLCSQQNGLSLNDERGLLNSPYVPLITHPWPHLGVENIIHSNSPMLNGWTRELSDIRISQGQLEAFTAEDSLIIPGEGLNHVMNKGFGRPRGRNCKGSLHEIGVAKPREKRSELDGYPQFAGIHENSQKGWQYYSLTLPPKCNSLEEARGYIYLMAKDQHGCRFLQTMFKTPQDVQVIFNEVLDHVVELMVNPFGNYLMQKLLEVCNEEQRTQILLMISEEPGQLVRISLNTHGTRVVQQLIKTLKTRQQISLVISALEPGFLALVKDVNGNHVVQRCLERLSNNDNKFIFAAAAKHCVDIATHRHGCCVLQRCISHSSREHRDNLVAEISANGLLLAQDAFGNFVIQFILELKIPSASSVLISHFEGNYVHLSTQKFSSHVVEKCLVVFDDEMRSKIIHEFLSASHFKQLLQDPHANYVIQTALRVTEGSLHNLLVDAIESHKAISRNSPYSKRIFSRKLLKK
ncbi:Pumilio 7 like [Actinidia chinensis var. chinensis]|uniref:Pumilio 7 like n=1 Tax=Actinidia chinensis var. chinensis TaxID=1590841 RepID=A0A2R6RGR8_ACTCC|nr:Pumilio 7 like [Actinidia chinensis var. chinensis]